MTNSEKLQRKIAAAEELANNGATEGERQAAIEALKRLTKSAGIDNYVFNKKENINKHQKTQEDVWQESYEEKPKQKRKRNQREKRPHEYYSEEYLNYLRKLGDELGDPYPY